MLRASDLWAIANGQRNEGDQQCHYCGAACRRTWTHDDPPPVPFIRVLTTAKCPGNAWVCVGCHIYRRGSVTVNFLTGGMADRQKAKDHSWWVTEQGAWAVGQEDAAELYRLLLAPPGRFCLSLRSAGDNLLQSAIANDAGRVTGQTQLSFSLDGTAFTYTPYELTDALKRGGNGKESGVQTLLRFLGPFELPPEPVRKSPTAKGGRPPTIKDAKVIHRPVASGQYDY